MGDAYAGMSRHEAEFNCASEHVAHIRESARKLAKEAGLGSRSTEERAGGRTPTVCAVELNVSRVGGAHCNQVQVKTPKYPGKADWEAFHAQFELLARAAGWSEDIKALQLALCLTDEASTCLLLLCLAERENYGALVGALQRRFGQCNQPGVLRSELSNRKRRSVCWLMTLKPWQRERMPTFPLTYEMDWPETSSSGL